MFHEDEDEDEEAFYVFLDTQCVSNPMQPWVEQGELSKGISVRNRHVCLPG